MSMKPLIEIIPRHYLQNGEISFRSKRILSYSRKSRISRNPKFHYRTHKCPPPVPSLSQMDPGHIHSYQFLKILLRINLASKRVSHKWSVSLKFPPPKFKYVSPITYTFYVSHPSHSSPFFHKKNNW